VGLGWWLDLMVSEVFSNLDDSVILSPCHPPLPAITFSSCYPHLLLPFPPLPAIPISSFQRRKGQEDMASSCVRGGSNGISGKISSLKWLSSIGPGCPGQWGSPQPWRGSKTVWMWPLGTGLSRHGGVGLEVGLGDHRGLVHPSRFHESLILRTGYQPWAVVMWDRAIWMALGANGGVPASHGAEDGLKLRQKRFKLDIGKMSFLKKWSGLGPGCPGQWGSPHPWRGSKTVWMWPLGTWLSRRGGVGLAVGLDDLRGFLQP